MQKPEQQPQDNDVQVAQSLQPPIRAVTMGLFPTADSLQSVIDMGYAQLPIQDQNALLCLLMVYHNSLLKAIADETKQEKL